MSTGLTEQQRRAIDRYLEIVDRRPDWFSDRPGRPIVLDAVAIAKHAETFNVVLGVAFESEHLVLLNDLVRSTFNGQSVLHPYLRIVPPLDRQHLTGVVVVATDASCRPERFAFVHIDRHATGSLELELPRGFGEAEDPADDARRELEEETGFSSSGTTLLGCTFTDTGTTSNQVSYFHIAISSTSTPEPEAEEGVRGVVMLTREEVWANIDSGVIRDGFTIQAFALYERALANGRLQPREGPKS